MKLLLVDDEGTVINTFDEGDLRETVDMFGPKHISDSEMSWHLRKAVEAINERQDSQDWLEEFLEV